jgi:hypothetical protein
MLQDFITSALIIDDEKSEVEKLIEFLDAKDIWVKHFTPEKLDKKTDYFNNRKLIFLDLYLDSSKDAKSNISKIRSYFSKLIGTEYGSYGIVLWTKHPDEVNEFKEKIYISADKYIVPLFVVALNKNEYLRKDDFSSIIEDLEKLLEENISSSFFIEWNKAVKKGSDETISRLYNLFNSDKKRKQHLEYILYKLALNYTGIPEADVDNYDLQRDLVKSLMDSLQFEISSNYQNINELFSTPKTLTFNDSKEEKIRIFAELNSFLLLDTHNLNQDYPIPGNIYQLKDNQNQLYISSTIKRKGNKEEVIDLSDKINKRIVLEITPPCDFSNAKKQKQSRIIGGVILDYNNAVKEYFRGDGFYTDLYPISVKPYDEPQMIIFDFYKFQTINESELKDNTKYEIVMKAKDKLFADILQKLSSHTARLGIANLKP